MKFYRFEEGLTKTEGTLITYKNYPILTARNVLVDFRNLYATTQGLGPVCVFNDKTAVTPLSLAYGAPQKLYNLEKEEAQEGKYEKLLDQSSCDIEKGCPLADFNYINFWHFLMECAPKVVALERLGFDGAYIFPKAFFKPYIYSWLAYMNVPKERIVLVENPVRVKELYLPLSLVHSTWRIKGYSGSLLLDTRSYMLKPIARKIPLWGKGKLYITRKETRRCLNEEDYRDSLEQRGIKFVDMAVLPLEEQILLAASSNYIIGPHGAAMAHTMFMPYFSTIVELFSSEYTQSCVFEQIRLLGHNYYMLVSKSEPDESEKNGSPTFTDMRINDELWNLHLENSLGMSCGFKSKFHWLKDRLYTWSRDKSWQSLTRGGTPCL